MPVHKILRGEGAERYLPFGLARARAMRARLGLKGFGSERFVVEGFEINIQQEAKQQYVRIVAADALRYEFFTSEHIADSTYASPGFTGPPPYVSGSATRARFRKNGVSAAGLYSNVITPGEDDGWTLRDTVSAQDPETGLHTWRSWQNQKWFEHCWWPGHGSDSLVTSTQAQSPGWGNTAGWLSPYRFRRISNTSANFSDVGLDVRPALYTKGGVIAAAPELENAWTWWRRACVKTVGDRRFFVCTDNFGRFFIYAVKEYGAEAAALPPAKYQVYTPPYPAWVTVPSVSDYRQQLKQWLWRFNKDASKCVAIAFHTENTEWKKFQTTGGASQFCAILPEDVGGLAAANITTAQEDTPGLVEFDIDIEVTGDGDMDFDATFTLARESYFPTTGRFFFDAAYFLRDVEHPALIDGEPNPEYIETDCLVTAEVECRVPTGYYTASLSNAWANAAVDAVRQMTADIVVSTNDADMVATERLRFTAMTPCWFQFPTIASIRDSSAELAGLSPTTITGSALTFYAAGPIRYDPDTHLTGMPGTTPWSGPWNVGRKIGYLYALELTTLSACYEVTDETVPSTSIYGVAYGEEFYRLDVDLSGSQAANPGIVPPELQPATTPVPSARVHQAVFEHAIETAPGQGFSVHPDGHWAFQLGGVRNPDMVLENALDWISVRGKDGTRTRYTHKDLYNTAFSQTRDYSFYHAPYSPPVPEITLADYGSFRTAGFWVTFR